GLAAPFPHLRCPRGFRRPQQCGMISLPDRPAAPRPAQRQDNQRLPALLRSGPPGLPPLSRTTRSTNAVILGASYPDQDSSEGSSTGIMCSVSHTIRGTYHMKPKILEDGHPARHRRRLSTEIKESLRELTIQLALLNHQVVAHLDFKDGDLPCLDLISRYGPLSP